MNYYCALLEREAIVDWRSVGNSLKTRSGTVHWVTRLFTNSYPSLWRRLWLTVSWIWNSLIKCLLTDIPNGGKYSSRYLKLRFVPVWLIKRKIVRHFIDVKRNRTCLLRIQNVLPCRLSQEICQCAVLLGKWNFNHKWPKFGNEWLHS